MEWQQLFDGILNRTLLETISGAAAFAALSASASTAIGLYKNWRGLERAATTASFSAAIQSNDISALGSYLTKTLGAISIHEYARRPEAADRIDRHLAAIEEFLAQEQDGPKDSSKISTYSIASPEFEPSAEGPSWTNLPSSLSKAAADLYEGSIWNALAVLRRDIEVRLQRMLPAHDKTRRGPSQLIRYMLVSERLPATSADLLRRAVKTASRAIHGEDVSLDEAVSAFSSAVRAYHELGWQ